MVSGVTVEILVVSARARSTLAPIPAASKMTAATTTSLTDDIRVRLSRSSYVQMAFRKI
jgi:hypothetical protein